MPALPRILAAVSATFIIAAAPTLVASSADASVGSHGPVPSHYHAVNLGSLGGSMTVGFGLNDRGQVVGQSETSSGWVHPFLWQHGRMVDLGLLADGGNGLGIARDINIWGDVVGGSDGPNEQRAVLWRHGRIVDLGTLGGTGSFANAINDRGQIVGSSMTAAGELHGFLWDNGRMRDLGIPGTTTVPLDINNLGHVVGWSDFGDGYSQHAFLWRDGTTTRLQTPGRSSQARAINNRGEIAGAYVVDIPSVEPHSLAVGWYHGTMTELATLPGGDSSGAIAINDSGQILGSANVTPHSLVEHTVIWWRGARFDLVSAGVPENSAYTLARLNNRGQLVAGDTLFNPA